MTGYRLDDQQDSPRKSMWRRIVTPRRVAQVFAAAVLVDGGFNDGAFGETALKSTETTYVAGQVYGAWGRQFTGFTKFVGIYDVVTSPFRKDYY